MITPKTVIASEVGTGDRIRSRGLELSVTRIESPFLGKEGMIAFIEDSDEQWLKLPAPINAEIEIISPR